MSQTNLRIIHLDDIIIGERIRQTFNPLSIAELADSIQSKGLLHPPVITPEGKLVAGERRYRAVRLINERKQTFQCNRQPIPAGMIPATYTSELSPTDLLELELEENTARADLSWQEISRTKQKLAALRRTQAEEAELPEPTLKNLAADFAHNPVGMSEINDFSRDLILAEHLDDPNISKAKNPTEAFRLVKKKLEREMRSELAAALDHHESPHTFIHGNCLDELPRLPKQSFDVILTDPPYGMGADSFGSQALNRHLYNDTPSVWNELIPDFLYNATQLAKPQAHMFLFCDIRGFKQLAEMLVNWSEWHVWSTPIIWYKGNMGHLPWPEVGPRRTYECILYAIRGKRHTVKPGWHDTILNIPATAPQLHAAQKPVALYEYLLSLSTTPGDTVLDPFAGSGTIFPAAQAAHCVATGIEQDAEQAGNCQLRIEELLDKQ